MRRYLPIFGVVALFLGPTIAYATPVAWDFTSNVLQPLISGATALVKGDHFQATSTTVANVFPLASTTITSANTLCLLTDCRSIWPSGGTPGGASSTVQYNANGSFGGGNIFTDGTKLGIGTTSPWAPLSILYGGDYLPHSNAASTTLFAIASSTAGAATTTLFQFNADGSFLFGNATDPTRSYNPPPGPGKGLATLGDFNQIIQNFTELPPLGLATALKIMAIDNYAPPVPSVHVNGAIIEATMATTSTSDVTALTGVQASAIKEGSGNVNVQLNGIVGLATNNGSGTVPQAWGGDFWYANGGTGTIGTAIGVKITNQTTLGRGPITNGYGIYIVNQNLASNNWDFYSEGTTTPSYFGGSLGIGTTSPWGNLSVSVSPLSLLQQSATYPLFVVASTTNQTLFNVLGNGNVGISSTTPGSLLSVGTTAGINFYDNATSTFQKGIQAFDFCTATKCLSSVSGGGGTNYFTLTGNNLQNNVGNALGINTAPNAAALEVMGTTSNSTANGLAVWNSSASPLLIARNDGNVGVGTSSPSSLLTIQGSVASNIGAYKSQTGSAFFPQNLSVFNANQTTGSNAYVNILLETTASSSVSTGSVIGLSNQVSDNAGISVNQPTLIANSAQAIHQGTGLASIVQGDSFSSRNAGAGSTVTTLSGAAGSVINSGIGATTTTASGLSSALIFNGAFGLVTNSNGISLSLSNSNANSTVTNAIGVNIAALVNAGTIASTTGVFIGSQTAGTQTNHPYGIYQSGTSDWNYFGGVVGIGTSTAPYTVTAGTPLLNVAGGIQVGGRGVSSGGIDFIRPTDGISGAAYMRWVGASGTNFELSNSSGNGVLRLGAVSSVGDSTRILGNSSVEIARFANANASVGIGTTSPLAKLDVAGTNNGTAPLFQLSSVASFATTTRFAVLNNGNVGIGIGNPARSSLEIMATTSDSGSNPFTVWNAASANIFNIGGDGSTTASNGFNITNGCYAVNGTCLGAGGSGTVTSVAASVPSFLSISGSPITTSGTLAITYSGMALPILNGGTNATSFSSGQPVYYNGTSLVSTSTLSSVVGGTGSSTPLGGILVGNGTGAIKSLAIGSGITFDGTTITSTGYSPIGSTGQFPYFSASNTLTATSSLFLASTGFVGIGTTTPIGNLSIQPTANNASVFNVANAAGSTVFNIDTTASSPFLGVGSTYSTSAIFSVGSTTATVGPPNFEIDTAGHVITSGPKPAISGGTSTVVGNDNNGTITVIGTLLTSVTITFATAWGTAPDCTMSDNSTGITADISSISTTQIVFGFSTGINSGIVWYSCRGHQ